MSDLDDIIQSATSSDDTVFVDFSEAADFEVIPDGEYAAVIESAESGFSKEGKPKIVWKFVLTDEAVKGRVLYRHTPTTGRGAGLSKQVLKAIGVETDGPQVRFKLSQAVGKRVTLAVGRQKDNPDFNEIKRVKPAPVGIGTLGL